MWASSPTSRRDLHRFSVDRNRESRSNLASRALLFYVQEPAAASSLGSSNRASRSDSRRPSASALHLCRLDSRACPISPRAFFRLPALLDCSRLFQASAHHRHLSSTVKITLIAFKLIPADRSSRPSGQQLASSSLPMVSRSTCHLCPSVMASHHHRPPLLLHHHPAQYLNNRSMLSDLELSFLVPMVNR